jgi:hypothetical protein
MWQFALPALQAVGINAGVNLLRRKPLFQNAGTAAVTGGVLGGFNGGGLFSSSPTASAVPTTSGAFESSMGLSNLPGMATAESIPGMVAGADGVLRSSDYFANILGNQVYTGNEGLLSQIGTGASSIFDTAKTELGDSITPQNLIGVSSILSNMANTPRPVASNMGGSQITGTPPKFEPFQTGQVYTRKRGNR